METLQSIEKLIKEHFHSSTREAAPIGKGASGSVYRVLINKEPFTIAMKVSSHPELMKKEAEMLCFLKEKTESKIPDVYFYAEEKGKGFIAMEFIEGTSGTDKSLLFKTGKKHLAESIIDNLLLIQKATNDKFGPFDNAVYDTWQEYYKQFADKIYSFCLEKSSQGELEDIVMQAVELSYKSLDSIFADTTGKPTLIHGDYWMPNFIIDKKKMELKAVVDPFNVMWAEPEYELFAMTVGSGKKLKLYELYKSRVTVSTLCDLKLEMYALYSELLWYKKLGSISHSYLKERSKGLLKQMKKNSII